MSKYNFEGVKPFDASRSNTLQETIRRNLYWQDLFLDEGPGGRLRSAKFTLGAAQARPSLPGEEGEEELPVPPPAPAPHGTIHNPFYVASGHYGGLTFAFNFQGATSGGTGNNEIRVSPYLDAEHIEVKALWIVPYSGVSSGQFIELRRAMDDDIAPTAMPTGSIIGPSVGRVGQNPAPDNERAIAVPTEATLLDTFRHGWEGGCYLKARLYFVAPAVALPIVSVIATLAYRHGVGANLFAMRS